MPVRVFINDTARSSLVDTLHHFLSAIDHSPVTWQQKLKKGGLALPSLVGLFKRLQATKIVQLLTSQDAGVWKAADLYLVEEKEKKRLKFRSAALVDSIRSQHPPRSCQGLTRAAKTLLSQEEDDERHQSLCQLSTQGEMA